MPSHDNTQNSNTQQGAAQATGGGKIKKMVTKKHNDPIDKGLTMTGAIPDKIIINPEQKNLLNNSFGNFFGEPINELTTQQRMKKAINFKRIKSKVELARNKSMLRKGSAKVIAKRAKVLALNIIKTKLAGNRKISDLSAMEKQRIEKIMGKNSDGVNRLALRLIPAVKKKEAKRFLKKEFVDTDNLKETVDFINEMAVNCAGFGGIRGMGYISGSADTDSPNYVFNNVADANEINNLMQQMMQDHEDIHYSDGEQDANIAPQSDTKDNILTPTKNSNKTSTSKIITKESVKLDPNDSHQRDDGTDMLVKTFKHDTPGEKNKVQNLFKRTAKVNNAFESFLELETREAIPRSGQPRKKLDLTVRNLGTDRKTSTGPYRQQEIQKQNVDEAEVWDKPNPVKHHEKLSPVAKAKAKARAKSHGRPYPNMVDNMWAARNEEFNSLDEVAAWQRKEGKNQTGGLNQKGVDSYRREHPGSHLQTAVTTKPSKLKPGSKAEKRRKSFCARMSGMPGPMKDDNGKPTRKALSLRKWNCHEDLNVRDPAGHLIKIKKLQFRGIDMNLHSSYPGKSSSSGGGGCGSGGGK